MRVLPIVLILMLLCACSGYEIKNLAKSDIDLALKGEKVTLSLVAKLKYHFEEETYLPFFVDVLVKDDRIVTNIAPNDIRGHWRSDAVELCFDPAAGSEDTLGAFKVGIFPFDTTGVVRAARDADANQGPIEETAPGTRVTSHRTVDGYRIQAAIPFSEIGLAPGKKRLGFNVIIYDGDKPDAALGENINKSRIAWAPRSGVQGRPEDWGRIDLE